jgi:hypothetical protein
VLDRFAGVAGLQAGVGEAFDRSHLELVKLTALLLVPFVARNHVAFVSPRVGNYQFHPQWGTLLDQLWVR